MWWRFRHVIKMMADVENILNDEEFLEILFYTPKKGAEQHSKQECLKGAISKDKGQKRRNSTISHETINKTYAEYKQHELNEKDEKTGKALGKHLISLYSTGTSLMWLWLKSKM